MTESFEIRKSLPSDSDAIEILYPKAFPEEDLLPVVRQLLKDETQVISFVAVVGEELVGHVSFTYCGLDGSAERVAMLAPLAVAPERQKRGIGKALVNAGFQHLEESGIGQVYVLGDPGYYGRFGFTPDYDVGPPYPMPEEWRDAWQSVGLGGKKSALHGQLIVPEAWRDPALWGP